MKRDQESTIKREARKALMGKVYVGGYRGRTDRVRTASWTTPVVFVDGVQPPTLTGEGYWKTAFRGPGGFTKVLYTYSTLRIVVGRDWRPVSRCERGAK